MKVKIYKSVKSPVQSGKKNYSWLLKVDSDRNDKSIDEVMGWTSSDDTLSQLRLKFNNLEGAVNYAQSKGWQYMVVKSQSAKVVQKSYADNFINS